ncbi:hypothetical protein Tco_0771202 [Tanacetum coccineum]|uniref:Uncharacterized protein n=1 Tax=Tanacetum coccineum TaxID=301880 RepID=A0ABQ4ZFP5_9ASTR
MDKPQWRIPIELYLCRIEERLVIRDSREDPDRKEGAETMKREPRVVTKNGSNSGFLEYSTSKEDYEKGEKIKKKRLKEASESHSNTLPLDYTSPNEETEVDLDSTARYEAKPKELENTCESSVRSKPDSPQTVLAYMLPDYTFHRSFF